MAVINKSVQAVMMVHIIVWFVESVSCDTHVILVDMFIM